MKNKNTIFLVVFSFIGVIVSAVLIDHHVNPETKSKLIQAVCDIGGSSGCDTVNQSDASSFLGMPVAFWGFLFYSFALCFAIFYWKHKKIFFVRFIFWLSLLALIVDVTLLLYSILIVETICNLCVITYFATLGTLIMSAIIIKNSEKQSSVFCFSFDYAILKEQPVTTTILLFSLVAVIFLGSFVFLHAKSSSTSISSSKNHNYLLEEAWKSFKKEYDSTKVNEIPIEHSPYKGSVDPVITIVEFADFLCPHCRLAGNRLNELMKKYEKSVKVVFKNYPLDQECNKNIKRKFHEGACKIAYLGLCASRQKTSSFWTIHDKVFAMHKEWKQSAGISDAEFTKILHSTGINLQTVSTCYKNESSKPDVIKDIELADSIKLTSTPTIFINGKKLKDGIPNDYFFEKLLSYEVTKQMGRE